MERDGGKLGEIRSALTNQKDSCRSSSLDCSINAKSGNQNSLESITQQLLKIRRTKGTTRIMLHGVVDLNSEHPNALIGLRDLFWKDSRSWKAITFCDTVQGNSYRQWLIQKSAVRSKMQSLQVDRGLQVIFRSRVELDWQDMTKERIVAVLRAVQKDIDVTTVTLKGAMKTDDQVEVMEALTQLMTDGRNRVWEGIIFHTSFAGASRDYPVWNQKFKRYSRQLEQMAMEYSIPVGVKLLSSR